MEPCRPTSCGHDLYALEDLSVSDDSGHREVEEDRVVELLGKITAGEYGSARSTAQPTVRFNAEGGKMMCADGRLKLADGKHWITALMRAKKLWQDAPADRKPDWCLQALLQIFERGIMLEALKFQDDQDEAGRWAHVQEHIDTDTDYLGTQVFHTHTHTQTRP
ncbi:unnamed protein product [Symbiodinium necroappetens]|uniref:Uncharacterized protein n=1 Tax=Symbiodinium necroappetens TaxID=1628268 RepID=A0A812ZQF8_9DINO|nr:unnamed protein product [Symbiodinium necroappetens]